LFFELTERSVTNITSSLSILDGLENCPALNHLNASNNQVRFDVFRFSTRVKNL
jgi:hypothetical protein